MQYMYTLHGGAVRVDSNPIKMSVPLKPGQRRLVHEPVKILWETVENSHGQSTATWNKVMMRYCDGASFSGNNETTVVYKGKTLHWRGQAHGQRKWGVRV